MCHRCLSRPRGDSPGRAGAPCSDSSVSRPPTPSGEGAIARAPGDGPPWHSAYRSTAHGACSLAPPPRARSDVLCGWHGRRRPLLRPGREGEPPARPSAGCGRQRGRQLSSRAGRATPPFPTRLAGPAPRHCPPHGPPRHVWLRQLGSAFHVIYHSLFRGVPKSYPRPRKIPGCEAPVGGQRCPRGQEERGAGGGARDAEPPRLRERTERRYPTWLERVGFHGISPSFQFLVHSQEEKKNLKGLNLKKPCIIA